MERNKEASETLGVCPCCIEKVYSDHLYVKEDKEVYHFYCHNIKKSKE